MTAKIYKGNEEYNRIFWNTMNKKIGGEQIYNVSKQTGGQGGYLVPDEFEQKIIKKLEEENIIRKLATVIETSGGSHEIPIESDYGTANWMNEESQYTESDVAIDNLILEDYKMGTIAKATEELANDTEFNLEDYLAGVFSKRFANLEKAAYINGDGVGKPTGLLQGGILGVTGEAGQTTEIKPDALIELFHSLPQSYRENATWLMSDTTALKIRSMKDSSGNYLWREDGLLGRPVEISNHVPNMEAGAKSILFGDFSFYRIGDKKGSLLKRLGELFSNKGQVGFIVHKGVDGKLSVPESVVYYQNPSA